MKLLGYIIFCSVVCTIARAAQTVYVHGEVFYNNLPTTYQAQCDPPATDCQKFKDSLKASVETTIRTQAQTYGAATCTVDKADDYYVVSTVVLPTPGDNDDIAAGLQELLKNSYKHVNPKTAAMYGINVLVTKTKDYTVPNKPPKPADSVEKALQINGPIKKGAQPANYQEICKTESDDCKTLKEQVCETSKTALNGEGLYPRAVTSCSVESGNEAGVVTVYNWLRYFTGDIVNYNSTDVHQKIQKVLSELNDGAKYHYNGDVKVTTYTPPTKPNNGYKTCAQMPNIFGLSVVGVFIMNRI